MGMSLRSTLNKHAMFFVAFGLLGANTSAFSQDSDLNVAPEAPFSESAPPNAPETKTPEAEVPPEDRLDDLQPFDPEILDQQALDDALPLKEYVDPDRLDDGLRDLLQNLPGAGLDRSLESDVSEFETEAESEENLESDAPDYSKISRKAEKLAKLDRLFERLAAETDEENADLIAEEIWAVWLTSGSATVDFLVRRGTAAQKRQDFALARRMYDHVTALVPEYAEGWSRSARLAIDEEDLNRALVETVEALRREPRHFYALWTMGNILERLGREEAALQAYVEAHRLYPELAAVKDRVDLMQNSVDGNVL